MIIICKKIDKSFGIAIDQEYEVLAISFNLHSKLVSYNIIDNFKRLAFYEDNLFEVMDGKIDPDWILKKESADFYILLPFSFSNDTFYEDFHNDEPYAIQKFKERYPYFNRP